MVHKMNTPLHPIVPAIKSVTYHIAKQILSSLCCKSVHHIKDSVDFIASNRNIRITRNEMMVSIDM